MELLCDLFLSVVQSQAVEEHDTWQHAFSDVDTVIVAKDIDGDSRILPGVVSAARMPLYSSISPSYNYGTENKYNKLKLNKRNENTTKQAKRISTTFHIASASAYLLIKRFRRLASKFSTESMPKCTHISLHIFFDIAPNILYAILFTVNCIECLSAEFV